MTSSHPLRTGWCRLGLTQRLRTGWSEAKSIIYAAIHACVSSGRYTGLQIVFSTFFDNIFCNTRSRQFRTLHRFANLFLALFSIIYIYHNSVVTVEEEEDDVSLRKVADKPVKKKLKVRPRPSEENR